ncbi:WS/DGAT domain-containing protein [Mycobacterium spongiae]|uniref:DUF1298 domain-containing protein n=1 Tax=Mycobacterium spongiae TaxID=886343 RepID=A0A975JUT4_9MYCO|nr:WS/DGAT domain-containing protein [Mycobacterium spongiae]QUR66097.1 DUF1298 domain-containing protein [Mycobacterium spongiae]
MRQLTSLDAQFLAVEEDGRAHAHIGALSIYDPSTASGGALTLQAVRDLIAKRIERLGQRAVFDPPAPPANVVISNVPGSPEPLYLAGAQLLAQYPVSMIVHGAGLNITVSSYRDSLDIGVLTDRDLIDDAWPVLAHIKAELAKLCTLIPTRGRRRRKPGKPSATARTRNTEQR